MLFKMRFVSQVSLQCLHQQVNGELEVHARLFRARNVPLVQPVIAQTCGPCINLDLSKSVSVPVT